MEKSGRATPHLNSIKGLQIQQKGKFQVEQTLSTTNFFSMKSINTSRSPEPMGQSDTTKRLGRAKMNTNSFQKNYLTAIGFFTNIMRLKTTKKRSLLFFLKSTQQILQKQKHTPQPSSTILALHTRTASRF